ncbi:hypothetical protein IJH01_03045 [Candidatus Saccharibacteria bacterium]|nr:hypothetical protein [Candidatus Saccharibacteria bacterium]MBQ3445988.1 hypothetical protein [Candidatus Saccharibacteria bacterium]
MSVLTSLGILVLSALILVFLQLVPGIFALFNHYMHGKFSYKKASDLATFFIIGVETAVVLVFLCLNIILCCSPTTTFIIDSDIFAWLMSGIFLALAFIILGLYFRKSSGTELFISRRLATSFRARLTQVKSRSDAFVLGLISIVPELIFTLPVYFLIIITIMKFNLIGPARAGLIMLFALIVISPLIIIRILNSTGHNLADYLKFRFKNKPFFRFCLTLFYLLIASLIVLGVSL